MFQPKQSLKRNLSLLLAFSGSLLLSLTTQVYAGGPPPQTQPTKAQPDSTQPTKAQPNSTQPTKAQPTNTQSSPQKSEAPARFPNPSARIVAKEGKITIKLVNSTNSLINYQVIGDTQQRTLGEQSQVLLDGLKIPITVTYQRPDGGFLLVRPQATDTPGVLQVTFTTTNDFNIDTKSLEVYENGAVFLH